MSGKVRLTVACGDYEIIRALKEGVVTADGLDLVFLTGMGSREFIARMTQRTEFDVCEMGVTSYAMSRCRDGALTAIPVFLHRRFRHGFVFVNAAASINTPKDLMGRRVGGMLQPAANAWMRGILEEHYGVVLEKVRWVGERREAEQFTLPKAFPLEMAPAQKSLEDLLIEGDLAAMISPSLPKALLKRDPRVGYLFPNYKEVEIDYFQKTGIFPIMHLVTVKREIVEKYPWVTTNLTKAFEQAKRIAYRRLINPRIVPLAWYRWTAKEQEEILGSDPWAYGLDAANKKNLDTLLGYMLRQGLIDRKLRVEELFADYDPISAFQQAEDEARF